jgi:hypothetical protein
MREIPPNIIVINFIIPSISWVALFVNTNSI